MALRPLWAFDLHRFGDDACAALVGTVHADRGWVFERPSVTVVRLDVRTPTVTPHVEGFIAHLESLGWRAPPWPCSPSRPVPRNTPTRLACASALAGSTATGATCGPGRRRSGRRCGVCNNALSATHQRATPRRTHP